MNEDIFWKIIQETVQAKTQEDKLSILDKELRKLTTQEVKYFDKIFNRKQAYFPCVTTYLDHLLNKAGYSFSDDSWIYFISWIIMQGEEVYEQAMREPKKILSLLKKEPSYKEDKRRGYRPSVPGFELAEGVSFYILRERGEE